MRILHINNNYIRSPLHGILIKHLDFLEFYSIVYSPTFDLNEIIVPLGNSVIVSECFCKYDRYFFYLKQYKIFRDIVKKVQVDTFDYIHAYTLFTDGYCAYRLYRKYGIPYVVAVRNTDVNTFFRYMWHLRSVGVEIMRHAKAVIFLSPAYRDVVYGKYVSDSLKKEIMPKTYIIPNGIDEFWHQNKFDGSRFLHSPLRLVYAGEITENKNILTTIKAMEILNQKGIEVNLTVVGPVKDRVVFDSFINHSQVMYHDAVPKEKLIDYYREADIFVMPSFTETFGLVYAEAMSQGLPVLYSKGQGFDGQFEEGQVGFAVDSHSAEDVANKIELVCKNYSQLSKNAVENVNKFRWDRIAEEYRGLYREV